MSRKSFGDSWIEVKSAEALGGLFLLILIGLGYLGWLGITEKVSVCGTIVSDPAPLHVEGSPDYMKFFVQEHPGTEFRVTQEDWDTLGLAPGEPVTMEFRFYPWQDGPAPGKHYASQEVRRGYCYER